MALLAALLSISKQRSHFMRYPLYANVIENLLGQLHSQLIPLRNRSTYESIVRVLLRKKPSEKVLHCIHLQENERYHNLVYLAPELYVTDTVIVNVHIL